MKDKPMNDSTGRGFLAFVIFAAAIWQGALYVFGPLPGAPTVADDPVYYLSSFLMSVVLAYLLRWSVAAWKRRQTNTHHHPQGTQ